jgi:hypothetical protein
MNAIPFADGWVSLSPRQIPIVPPPDSDAHTELVWDGAAQFAEQLGVDLGSPEHMELYTRMSNAFAWAFEHRLYLGTITLHTLAALVDESGVVFEGDDADDIRPLAALMVMATTLGACLLAATTTTMALADLMTPDVEAERAEHDQPVSFAVTYRDDTTTDPSPEVDI